MSVAKQLTLNVQPKHHDLRYNLPPEVLSQATREEIEDWLWLQHDRKLCEEYDRDEPDRFALGFDATILREERGRGKYLVHERGKYLVHKGWPDGKLDDPLFWRKMYLEAMDRLSAAQRELDEIHDQQRKEQEEYDQWCDKMEEELLELLHGPDTFPRGI